MGCQIPCLAVGVMYQYLLTSSSFNNYWELSWSSKEEADAAWKEWILNEDAMAWSEESSSILQCDGENRDGYDFIFPYDPLCFW